MLGLTERRRAMPIAPLPPDAAPRRAVPERRRGTIDGRLVALIAAIVGAIVIVATLS